MEQSNGSWITDMTACNTRILLIVAGIVVVLIRVVYVLFMSIKPRRQKNLKPISTLIVLGSGGHTAEMINLLQVLRMDRFKPRYYIAAATDNMSLQKARGFENSLLEKGSLEKAGTAKYMQIYRSREVGQSYLTSIGTTLFAIAHALWLMTKIQPEVVLYLDSLQWAWNLHTALCDCIHIQGIRDKVVVYLLCGEYCEGEKAIVKWFASLQTKNS